MTEWRAALSSSVRVPSTSVDWISSLLASGSAAAQCTTISMPAHCALDGRRIANIGLHDVDEIALGIIEGRDIHGPDLEPSLQQAAAQIDAEESGAARD